MLKNEQKKIFFLVSNLYIHLKPFIRIATLLKQKSIAAELFYMDSGINKKIADSSFFPKKEIRKFPPFRNEITGKDPASKIIQFASLIIDKYSFSNFLKRNRPDVVVTGGDVTDLHGRLLHDTCLHLGIKTLIVPVTIPGDAVVNPDANKGIPMAGLARRVSSCFGLYKTIFFRGWVLGSYDTKAVIALPDKSILTLLTKNGVAESRLFVTGNPVHDDLFYLLNQPRQNLEEKMKAELGIPINKKMLLYCTEVIQDVYGIDYLEKINSILEKSFSELPHEYIVVIKLHPREPPEIRKFYKDRFHGPRFSFTENTDIPKLIRTCEMTLAHYSAVLNDAALLGSPLLSIKADENMPVLFGASSDFIHTDPGAIAGKIAKLLFDTEFREEQNRLIRKWKTTNQIIVDGQSCFRIAELIANEAFRLSNVNVRLSRL